MKDVVFDERVYSEEAKEWTYYFTAPAKKVLDMFPGRYNPEDVVATQISIELPCERKYEYDFGSIDGVVVSISPTSEDEDGRTDYDWEDIDIPDSDILELLEKGMRMSFTFEEYWNSGLIIKDLCVPGACPLCDEIKDCISETTFATLKSMSKSHDAYAEIKRHAKQLYRTTCRGELGEDDAMFKVHISEVIGRTVVIFAEDQDEAYETAEELCNAEIINLDGSDFVSRTVEVIGKADLEDVKTYENYERNENID